jgi:hypothetical protein
MDIHSSLGRRGEDPVKLVPRNRFYTRCGRDERNSRVAAEISDSILGFLLHFLLLTSDQFGHKFAERRFAEPSVIFGNGAI